MTTRFEDLVKSPPLKSTTFQLPDKRTVTLYELTVSVMDDVKKIGQEDADEVDSIMTSISRVSAYALLGRAPTVQELEHVKGFGTSSVMAIYYKALKFSRLGPESLEETKKP